LIGIGTDIVSVERIRQIHQRFQQRFAQKILSQHELSEYYQMQHPVHFLAKRFAAKEATVKALGTGFSQGIHYADISIIHDAKGKPELRLSGVAEDISNHLEVNKIHLSISDEREYALAFVVCE